MDNLKVPCWPPVIGTWQKHIAGQWTRDTWQTWALTNNGWWHWARGRPGQWPHSFTSGPVCFVVKCLLKCLRSTRVHSVSTQQSRRRRVTRGQLWWPMSGQSEASIAAIDQSEAATDHQTSVSGHSLALTNSSLEKGEADRIWRNLYWCIQSIYRYGYGRTDGSIAGTNEHCDSLSFLRSQVSEF